MENQQSSAASSLNRPRIEDDEDAIDRAAYNAAPNAEPLTHSTLHAHAHNSLPLNPGELDSTELPLMRGDPFNWPARELDGVGSCSGSAASSEPSRLGLYGELPIFTDNGPNPTDDQGPWSLISAKRPDEQGDRFGLYGELPTFTNNGPNPTDDQGPWSLISAKRPDEQGDRFGLYGELPTFTDNGPNLMDYQGPWSLISAKRPDGRGEVVHPTGPSSWTAARPIVLPSVNQLARDRKIEGTNENVRSWLSEVSEGLPPPLATSDEPRPLLESQNPLYDVSFPPLTSNRRQPGRIYYIESEGQLREVDKEPLASDRHWVDEPMHLAIENGEPSLPVTSADAMLQYERMCFQSRRGHDKQDTAQLPAWLQILDRIRLDLDNAQGYERNQPQTSQEAITRYLRHADELSIASGAATWGTYRLGDQGNPHLRRGSGDMLEQVRLRPARITQRHPFRESIRQILSRGNNKSQLKPQGSSTDQDFMTNVPLGPLTQFTHEQNPVDFPILANLALSNTEIEAEEASQSTSEADVNSDQSIDKQELLDLIDLIDGSGPTIHLFRQHILALNPFLRRKSDYLIERIANHQLTRLQRLVEHRIRVSTRKETYSLAARGPANGEPATIDGRTAHKRAPDDEELNATCISIEPEHFPQGIPMPPTTRFPAEFECQICYRPKKLSKPSDWTKHIHEDVTPFSCTWEHCWLPSMFKRKADWLRHENEVHRRLEHWICDIGDCRHVVSNRTNFVQHLVREHQLPEPKAKTKAGMKRAGGGDPMWQKVQQCHVKTWKHAQEEPCKFCGKTFPTWKKLTVHLAKHMERISLPILRLVERVADDHSLTFVPGQGFLPLSRVSSDHARHATATITEETLTSTIEHESSWDKNVKELISRNSMTIHDGDGHLREDPAYYGPERDTRVKAHTIVGTDYLGRGHDSELSATQEEHDLIPLQHPTVAGTVLHTDSGYASLKRTMDKMRNMNTDPGAVDVDQAAIAPGFGDAATEYTDADSVGTLKRELYISDFAEDLFAKILDLHPEPEDVERISELLPDLLKAFALKLGFHAPTPVYGDVVYFVHKYRSAIANAFRDIGQREEEHPVDATSTSCARMPLEDLMTYQKECAEAKIPAVKDEKMPLNDLIASWFEGQGEGQDRGLSQAQEPVINDTADSPAGTDISEARQTKSTPSAKSEEIDDGNSASIMGYRSLVLETDAFKWLLARLRSEMRLVSTEPKAMEAIRSKIFSSLRPPGRFSRKALPQDLKATFELDWDVRDFFEQQQYEDKASEALPKVITLTGSDKDAQALTCAEYLSQTWPLTGSNMLKLVQNVLNSGDGALAVCHFPDGTKVSAWTRDQRFLVEAQGNTVSVAEVGEQIAWLATALRSSSGGGAITGCYPFISDIHMVYIPTETSSQAPATARSYEIGFRFDGIRRSVDQTNGQCWHDMFRNAVVVKGYPILSRAEAQTGMEVPLNIMAGLARTDLLDQFGGATFIKGFSSLLIPVRRAKDSIIWHLIYNSDGRRISYVHKILSHLGLVTTLDLANFRHILGWCAEAEFYAGSSQSNYIVGSSGLNKPPQSGALAGLFVSPGRGIMGGSTFILGQKDTPAHIARNGYIPKLQWISTQFVLLWDEADRRGWLVNGTSALLHIVRSSLAHNRADKFKAAFMFRPQDIQESGTPGTVDSAIDVLINPANLALKLYQEKDGHLLLQSRIDHYYNILEKLIDHQADIAGEDGSKLADHPRRWLEGWDFKDLATSRDPLYPRVTTLSGRGKAWVDLIRALHAVTLFGRGFGQLIGPRGTGTCDFWAELPKGKYYIAAGLCDLIQVADKNSCYNDDHVRLSQGIIWHTPTAIFGSCRCRGSLRKDHCEPVQSALPSSMSDILLARRLPIPEESSGAVIFGQHSGFPWIWKDHGAPQEEYSATSCKVSENNSTFDSGIGTSIGSSSNVNAVTAMSRAGTPGSKQPSSRETDAVSSNATSVSPDSYTAMDYTVGILCALPKELLAVRALFDRKHGGLEHIAGDVNHYCLGQIGNHMVVAACLPKGDYGTTPAADSASNMNRSFPNLKFCLLVGIGGGAPSKEHDIRLGDVVVSAPTGSFPGVIQYDRGKDNENRSFERTGSLRPPPRFLMTAISRLDSNPDRPSNPLGPYLTRIQDRIRFPERVKYQHPGQEHDTFSQTECLTCQGEGKCFERSSFMKQRSKRPTNDPQIFYGLIASGNRVIKDAHVRNEWADNCGVLCFEMEAAGIMNTFPCLVIRGICDYADSSKNKVWQEYAAATAAAYAKLLLEEFGAYAVSGGKSLSLAKRPRTFAEDELPRKQQRV
ncbi:Pfs domain protein [Sarocladium implicatum]|nr:Pfs domain protein [Sarocladium implicatum]